MKMETEGCGEDERQQQQQQRIKKDCIDK